MPFGIKLGIGVGIVKSLSPVFKSSNNFPEESVSCFGTGVWIMRGTWGYDDVWKFTEN